VNALAIGAGLIAMVAALTADPWGQHKWAAVLYLAGFAAFIGGVFSL
jgi:hypothetical protein